MKSMTGYGEGRSENERVRIYLQIKTLNHRFLAVEIYPPQLIPFTWEKTVKEHISEKIKRGKVIVDIEIRRKKLSLPKIMVNQGLVSRYYHVLSQISNELGLRDKIGLSHLLSLPEIIYLEREKMNKENISPLIIKALKKALGQVLQMREKEGKEHLHSMRGYLIRIRRNVSKIEREIPLVEKKYKARIKETLGKLVDQSDRKKVLNELSSLTWRSDVSEEKLRFRSHLNQFQATLREQEPMGTKLKFILQELQREINTLGIKVNTLVTSRLVIQIKEELERLREESQNIE